MRGVVQTVARVVAGHANRAFAGRPKREPRGQHWRVALQAELGGMRLVAGRAAGVVDRRFGQPQVVSKPRQKVATRGRNQATGVAVSQLAQVLLEALSRVATTTMSRGGASTFDGRLIQCELQIVVGAPRDQESAVMVPNRFVALIAGLGSHAF